MLIFLSSQNHILVPSIGFTPFPTMTTTNPKLTTAIPGDTVTGDFVVCCPCSGNTSECSCVKPPCRSAVLDANNQPSSENVQDLNIVKAVLLESNVRKTSLKFHLVNANSKSKDGKIKTFSNKLKDLNANLPSNQPPNLTLESTVLFETNIEETSTKINILNLNTNFTKNTSTPTLEMSTATPAISTTVPTPVLCCPCSGGPTDCPCIQPPCPSVTTTTIVTRKPTTPPTQTSKVPVTSHPIYTPSTTPILVNATTAPTLRTTISTTIGTK